MKFWFLGFAAAMLTIVGVGTLYLAIPSRAPSAPKKTTFARMSGPLHVVSPAEFSIGGNRVILCGVKFDPALRQVVTEAVRTKYEKTWAECVPVGLGTPCDGKSVSTVGHAMVGACKMKSGRNLATALVESGYLSGTIPEYSGAD
ncbi:hypothetical protein [Mesorhizobium sp.]|uniref:hypothetical protein n=1 Tax=Mesorhizobium sp. TaxID=1871066 RepID=UPI00120FDEC9|nr:hypothetical protein [Mesorhizobium sp.]TIN11646.1 MAG: hypothetical protein E5Y14_04805 [Mesorhizobium sp.]